MDKEVQIGLKISQIKTLVGSLEADELRKKYLEVMEGKKVQALYEDGVSLLEQLEGDTNEPEPEPVQEAEPEPAPVSKSKPAEPNDELYDPTEEDDI